MASPFCANADPPVGPMVTPLACPSAASVAAASAAAAAATAAASTTPTPAATLAAAAACGMTAPSAMGVSFCPSTRVFRLQTASTVYVMRISDSRAVEHLYYGPALGTDDDLTFLASSSVGQPMDAQWRPPVLTPATAGGHAALDPPGPFPSVGGAPSGGPPRFNGGGARPISATAAAAAATAAPFSFPPATVTVASSSSSASGVSSSGSSDSLSAAAAGVPGSLPSVGGFGGLDCSPNGMSFLDALDGEALPGTPGAGRRDAAVRRSSVEGLSSVLSHLTLPKSSTQESVANVDDLQGSLALGASGDVEAIARNGAAVETQPARSAESLTAAVPGVGALPPLTGPLSYLHESRAADRFSSTNWAALDPNRAGPNSRLYEFGSCSTGDYRTGSVDVLFADGSSSVSLEYVSHRVTAGKVPREDAEGAALPAVYVDSPDEATTLTLEMVDPDTGLMVELHYVVMHAYDVITRWSTVRNRTAQPVVLERLASATVDMEAAPSRYLTSLGGTWARERQVLVRKLVQGTSSFGSTRGGSSHQHNPFLAVSSGGEPQEESGDVMAMMLVYSGNFEASAEVNEQGRLRVSMGIHPDGFRWTLPRGGLFASPEVLLTASAAGMGTASRRLHRLIRDRLMPRRWRNAPRPLLLNTWEANYFAVSHEGVMDIARAAVPLGVDTVVLDDGWFSAVGRSSANAGLGDWFPNKAKVRSLACGSIGCATVGVACGWDSSECFDRLCIDCELTYCAAPAVIVSFLVSRLVHICCSPGMGGTPLRLPPLVGVHAFCAPLALVVLSALTCSVDASSLHCDWLCFGVFFSAVHWYCLPCLRSCVFPALAPSTGVPRCRACPHRNPPASLPTPFGYSPPRRLALTPLPPPPPCPDSFRKASPGLRQTCVRWA